MNNFGPGVSEVKLHYVVSLIG